MVKDWHADSPPWLEYLDYTRFADQRLTVAPGYFHHLANKKTGRISPHLLSKNYLASLAPLLA